MLFSALTNEAAIDEWRPAKLNLMADGGGGDAGGGSSSGANIELGSMWWLHDAEAMMMSTPSSPQQQQPQQKWIPVRVVNVDRDGLTVALGEARRFDDRFAHRRPNLATAPTMMRRAMAMMPAPTMPHMVEVETATRNCCEADSPRDATLSVGA